MSYVPSAVELRMTEELPLFTTCMAGGGTDDLYARLTLFDCGQLLALRDEVKVLYRDVRAGMEAAAQEFKARIPSEHHPRAEHMLRESISQLACLCSTYEGCINLHLKRLEAKS